MLKTCEECPKYKTCETLCATAEAYVNQDYVSGYSCGAYWLDHYPEGSGENFWFGGPSIDLVVYTKGFVCASESNGWKHIDTSFDNASRHINLDEVDLSFLTDREKICMVGYYFDGKSVKVIADEIGIGFRTVYTYLRNARDKCIRKFKYGEDITKRKYVKSGKYSKS